jgi:hypothetical protein
MALVRWWLTGGVDAVLARGDHTCGRGGGREPVYADGWRQVPERRHRLDASAVKHRMDRRRASPLY